MLGPGDRAPNFTLETHSGQAWELARALEQGPLVVFFYPQDDTPICTVEACGFRDRHVDFVGLGAQVVGISSDSVASHQRFQSKHELPYVLLSDPGGRVRRLFGVKKTLGLLEGRVTFVIDSSGIVRHAFSSALSAKKHVAEALSTLERLDRTPS